jgi:origin recognition complex subunit 1
MAPTRKRSRIEQARQYLTGGAVFREDSDDELGYEDLPWEWIYEDDDAAPPNQNATPRKRKAAALSRPIVAARMGSFTCKLGDTVLLKADGSQAWVGIICDFYDDEEEGEKMAKFLWFSSEREIRDKSTKRTDFMPVRTHWLSTPHRY